MYEIGVKCSPCDIGKFSTGFLTVRRAVILVSNSRINNIPSPVEFEYLELDIGLLNNQVVS